VSASLLSPKQQRPEEVDWARLIPGEMPEPRTRGKKPAQSVRAPSLSKVSEISPRGEAYLPEGALGLLTPHPLQSRTAWKWLHATSADLALVTANWLFLGTALIALREIFPRMVSSGFPENPPGYLLGIALLHGALITLMGYSEGLYADGAGLWRQARVLGKSVIWATAILGVAYGLQRPWSTSGLIGISGLLHFGALLTWRWVKMRQQGCTNHHGAARKVLIVGAGPVGRQVESYLESHANAGREVCGFLDDECPLEDRVVGRVSDLPWVARTGFVDGVILAAPHDKQLTQQVLRDARRLRLDVEMVPELFDCIPTDSEVERVGNFPVICLHAERLPAAGLMLKRVADVVVASFALTLLSPLLATLAGLIKLDSPGSVLYQAQRAGRKGRLFCCYKFRTMVTNADQLKDGLRKNNQRSGPIFKISRDPRITRLGHFLRRYSLDELPQLWNVLKGDMSLVGPRPHPLDDVAAYAVEHLARLDVTPGITGLWQVTARRDPSFQRGMELDREYIRTWSLKMDLRILLKTFLAVVTGSGE
jgi:exopolysaccharide biosynthesis polyprenyl glycosylphosphotransferase